MRFDGRDTYVVCLISQTADILGLREAAGLVIGLRYHGAQSADQRLNDEPRMQKQLYLRVNCIK